jgi:hypothetical protein
MRESFKSVIEKAAKEVLRLSKSKFRPQ